MLFKNFFRRSVAGGLKKARARAEIKSMPKSSFNGIKAPGPAYLYPAKERALSKSPIPKDRTHPILAPLAWFVCFLLGAAIWIVLVYCIIHLL